MGEHEAYEVQVDLLLLVVLLSVVVLEGGLVWRVFVV